MAMKSGEKTSFTLACGLLSQYMKEKGNLANLNLGNTESYRRPITMNLLPGAEIDSEFQEENQNGVVLFGSSISNVNEMELFPQSAGFEQCKIETEKEKEKEMQFEMNNQLKIVYGDKTFVFENFPKEKAKYLMNFASEKNSSSPQIEAQKSTKPIFSDLPIMRKKSLQRFLEKRKDRLNSKAPYQQQESIKANYNKNNQGLIGASIKKENCESESEPWLRLN